MIRAREIGLVGGLLLVGATVGQGQEASHLSIERIVATPSLTGTAPLAPVWSPDSKWLAFSWDDQGRSARDVWLVGRDGTGLRRLTRGAETGSGVGDLAWSVDGTGVWYLQDGDVWLMTLGGAGRRLTTDGGDKGELGLSPNGRWVSYLKDGDLWIVTAGGGAAVRLTEVGAPPIGQVPVGTYYRPDAEIGPGVWGGGPSYLWSPDSRTIAVHYVDRRDVRKYPIPYYLAKEPILNPLRRGAPGDTNERRTLGLVDVESRSLTFLDLPDQTSVKVIGYAWSPSGTLLIDRESDTSIDRWIDLVDAGSKAIREIWHDHRESRVYNGVASAWHPDGKRVLLLGDLDDRYRLYFLTPGEKEPRPVTDGGYDVLDPPIGNAAVRAIFFTANQPTPTERQVFRVAAEGGAATRVTRRPGTHTPTVSPDGKTIALLSSDDVTPSELYLVPADGTTAEQRITRSQPAEFARYRWVTPRYVSFPSKTESLRLHARILEPPDLDRGKKHPVLFGPVYSNTVRNRWAGLYGTLQQYLALEKGYIVVQVDVRGSTGYGRAFREKFLMDWGGGDLDDLESAVDYLKTLPYVDPDRIGIWGSSYGGTLTVFSLFKKPGLFKAGVAGAPAVDPRLFGSDDVAISRTPASNPETFTRGQAYPYAKNLRDHLLIIHGMEDDVVPFQTSVVLAEELIRLGKDFDFAFAPEATHGWTQRRHYATYLLGKLVAFFDRYLEPWR